MHEAPPHLKSNSLNVKRMHADKSQLMNLRQQQPSTVSNNGHGQDSKLTQNEGSSEEAYKNVAVSQSTASSNGGVYATSSEVSPHKRQKPGSTSSQLRKTSSKLRDNGKSIVHEPTASKLALLAET